MKFFKCLTILWEYGRSIHAPAFRQPVLRLNCFYLGTRFIHNGLAASLKRIIVPKNEVPQNYTKDYAGYYYEPFFHKSFPPFLKAKEIRQFIINANNDDNQINEYNYSGSHYKDINEIALIFLLFLGGRPPIVLYRILI